MKIKKLLFLFLFSLTLYGCKRMEKAQEKDIEMTNKSIKVEKDVETKTKIELKDEVLEVPELSKSAFNREDKNILNLCLKEIEDNINKYHKIYDKNIKNINLKDDIELMSDDAIVLIKSEMIGYKNPETSVIDLEYMSDFFETEAYNLDTNKIVPIRFIDIEKEEEDGEMRIDGTLIPIELLFESNGSTYCAYYSIKNNKINLMDIVNESFLQEE